MPRNILTQVQYDVSTIQHNVNCSWRSHHLK